MKYSIHRGRCCPWNSDGTKQITADRTYHFIEALGILSLELHELCSEKSHDIQKPADFAEAKEQFLSDTVSIVTVEEISPELVLNWGIHLVPMDDGASGF